MKVPLSETYRPKTFTEVVGVNELDKIKNQIADVKTMANLLFYGPAGTGKTSVAKIIIKELQPIDYIKINGSDTTGVDTIRERVYNFITSMSTTQGKPKIVWIEEFDYMSQNAFAALRSMMEQYMSNARFICTCNYINKIPEPIQSRFTTVEFSKAKSEEIVDRIELICTQEGIKITKDTLLKVVERGKGDIRTILNNIQQLSSNVDNTILEADLSGLNDLTDEVSTLLSEKNWTKIRYEIPNRHPDYEKLLSELEEKFFSSKIETSIKAKVTEIISTGLFEMSFSFDKNIAFAAVCSRIIKVI